MGFDPVRHGMRHLQQQRGFPDPRFAADQHRRARHDSAAEDAIELADARADRAACRASSISPSVTASAAVARSPVHVRHVARPRGSSGRWCCISADCPTFRNRGICPSISGERCRNDCTEIGCELWPWNSINFRGH